MNPKPQTPNPKLLNPEPTYLPFGELLNRLQDQGFELGPDHYIQVQELLQRYVKRDAAPAAAEDPLLALRYHLAALLTQSESQQAIFHQVFDAYVAEMEGPWYEVSAPPPPPAARRARWWLWLAAIPLLAFLWLWLRPLPSPEATAGFQATTPNSRLSQTLEFRDLGQYRYPVWTLSRPPEPERLHWDFGDGSSSTDPQPIHHYEEAGTYQVKLTSFFPSGDTIQRTQSLVVRPLERLQASFTHQTISEEANAYLLTSTSYVFAGDSQYRPLDTLQSLQLDWEVAGLGTFQGDSIRIQAPNNLDSLVIRLLVQASWPDTTAIDSAQRIIRQLQPPVFPSLREYLVDADLSDLIKQQPRNWWPVALLLALLLSYLAYELFRARQRKVSLNSAPERGPPSRHPLQLNEPGLELFQSREFYAIARELRRRRSGEQRKRPDLPRSIQKSAEAGGFPDLVWQTHSHPSQYLLLIEQQHPEDHLARLYAEIGRELASRDISVEVYFYQGDPRHCWRKKRREALPLSRLCNLYPDYRLLIIGYGDYLLHEDGRKLDPWTEAFESWQERGWLSIRPTESWGMTERALATSFVLVLATQLGLVRLVEQWQAEEPLLPQEWQQLSRESNLWLPEEESLPPDQLPALLTELRVYLGPTAFRWLAACSWYPDLRWGLSLQMAALLQHQEEQEAALQLDIDGLLRLFRLPWLRTGKLPEWLRGALAESLPEAEARAVRTHLLHLLSEPRNQPPEESYAEVDHVVRLAWLEYQNSAQSKADRKRLVEKLKDIDPEEIEDYLSLQELGKVPTALSPLLPARDFRGSIPLFGLRQRVRMRWLGIPLLLGLLGSLWFSWSGQRQEAYDPRRSYERSELNLQTALDTARWYNHEGYLIGTDALDSTDTGRDQFSAAFGLVPNDSLTQHNLRLAYYQLALSYYQADNLTLLLDVFNMQETVWQESTDYPLTSLGKWYEALWGTSFIMSGFLYEGSNRSYSALCDSVNSVAEAQERFLLQAKRPPPLNFLREQLDFERLIELRLGEASQNIWVAALLNCLGQDSLIQRPVFLNLRIQDAEIGQPLSGAELLLPSQDNLVADANGRIFFRYKEAPETRIPGQISLTIEAPGYFREGHVLRLLEDSTEVQRVRLRRNEGNLKLSASVTEGCAPLSGVLQATADKPVARYRFGIGDSIFESIADAETEFEIDPPGTYAISVLVEYADGERDTLLLADAIRVRNRPDIQLEAQPDSVNPLTWTFRPTGINVDSFQLDLG
ncbi:MAG: PKD domain-containing protein, partial [Bacteroidota bacterium]